MLTGDYQDIDLAELKEGVFDEFADLFDDHNAEEITAGETEVCYPVEKYPQSVRSLGLIKNPVIEEILYGIKGQYLIFDHSAFNIRNHQGYFVELSY